MTIHTLLALLLSASALCTSHAIILPPGVADADLIAAVATAPFFVSLDERGSCGGTVVQRISADTGKSDPYKADVDDGSAWVATAAHCFCDDEAQRKDTPTKLIFSDESSETVKASDVHFNPACMHVAISPRPRALAPAPPARLPRRCGEGIDGAQLAA